jgi:hypothetical protein
MLDAFNRSCAWPTSRFTVEGKSSSACFAFLPESPKDCARRTQSPDSNISLGGFTRDCEALGRRTSRRVTLIDGDALLDLWIEHFDEMDEEGRRLLLVRPVYYLDPDASTT